MPISRLHLNARNHTERYEPLILSPAPEQSNMNQEKDRRREIRAPLTMITLPFVATREADHQPFEYVLQDLSPSGARFAIPNWAANRDRLQVDDIVRLHLPLRSDRVFSGAGKVVRVYWDEPLFAQICAVSLLRKEPLEAPVSISTASAEIIYDSHLVESLPSLISRAVMDCIFLKKGVAIYLKHLIPYFSRIGGYDHQEYSQLKAAVLEDMRRQALEEHERLTGIHKRISRLCARTEDIPRQLNLEELRSLIESGINPDIFEAAFESELVEPYVSAIKELEKKLYTNFNTVVIYYLLSL